MVENKARLPREASDWITAPFARFLKIEAAAAGLLLLTVLVAMFLANSAWAESYLAFWETPIGLTFGTLDYTRSLRHWIVILRPRGRAKETLQNTKRIAESRPPNDWERHLCAKGRDKGTIHRKTPINILMP